MQRPKLLLLGLTTLVACTPSAGPEPKPATAPTPAAPTATAVTPPVAADAPTSAAPRWKRVRKITPSDTTAFDFYGHAIGMSGDTALVGAERHPAVARFGGAVYVYDHEGTGWVQKQTLIPPDEKESDYFGTSVALHGDTAVVGSPHHGERPERAGAVYVYGRAGGKWSQQQKLTAADAKPDDALGSAVATTGDTAFLGSPSNDEKGTNSGAVYVFTRKDGSWAQTQKLVGDDTEARDSFGCALAASDDTLLVGAVAHRVEGQETGAAYVLVRQGDRLVQQQKLFPSEPFVTSGFGRAVALSGDTALVGAHASNEAGDLSGSAFVFVRENGKWRLQQKLVARDGKRRDHFGHAVALSGDTAFVGSYSGESALDAGAVTVFVRREGRWLESQKLVGEGTKLEQFSTALAVAGSRALVSGNRLDGEERALGSVYAFELAP